MSLMESLPPPNTKRWVIRRKAAVVAAVRSGEITFEEACRRYQLSEEELLSWERAFEIHGLAGLRTTRIQQYRRGPRSARPRSASPKQTVESGLSRRA
jgi:transposase-like protein